MGELRVMGSDDFNRGVPGSFGSGLLHLAWPGDWTPARIYKIGQHVVALEPVDQQTRTSIGGAAGWGAAGAVVAGPAGAVAGALLGGRKDELLFRAEMSDGKHLVACCSKGDWLEMQAEFISKGAVQPGAAAIKTPAWVTWVAAVVVIGPVIWAFVSCSGS